MMKIKKTRILAFIDAVAAIATECRVWLKSDGLTSRAVDTANVAMVQATLPKEAFLEYTHNGKMEILGLDLLKLKTAIGLMKEGDLTITTEGGRIRIWDGKYDYGNMLLDLSTIRKDPNPPELNLPAAVTIDAREFVDAIRAMGMIGDKVRFSLKNKTLSLFTEGNTDALTKDLEGEPVASLGDAAVKSLFSSDYLKEIGRVVKGSEKVTIAMSNDHPIRMECTVDEIALEYLIAPRIEEGN